MFPSDSQCLMSTHFVDRREEVSVRSLTSMGVFVPSPWPSNSKLGGQELYNTCKTQLKP